MVKRHLAEDRESGMDHSAYGLSVPLRPGVSSAPTLGPPERSGASISPDGTRIAYLAPWKNHLNVWIQELDSDADPAA